MSNMPESKTKPVPKSENKETEEIKAKSKQVKNVFCLNIITDNTQVLSRTASLDSDYDT